MNVRDWRVVHLEFLKSWSSLKSGCPILRFLLAKGGLPSPKQQACLFILLNESPHGLVRGPQLRFNLPR